ncbi:MAG TPA: hypothetical protein VGH28_29765 [Polyangiaceae bacterium]|jgi:hypothetical protein
MSDPKEKEEEIKPERAPFLFRFGATVGVAALASLLGSSPAAVRMSEGGVELWRAWLTLAGLAVAPMLIAIPLARLAREGLRGLLPGEGALERAAGAIFFFCTWLWFDSLLGGMLRQKTHHRALGGVTFALVALGAGVFLALVARRLATILAALRSRRRPLGTAAAAISIALSVAVLGLRVARAAPSLSTDGRATLVDGLALALALAFFARKTFEERRLFARVGPPVAFVLLVLSMHTLATSQSAPVALEQVCPVHFAILQAFAHLPL